MKLKEIILKWWLWPLLLIVIQIIQVAVIFKCFHDVGTDVADWILRVAIGKDIITILSIILFIGNICLWFYFIIKKLGKAIIGHFLLMGVAAALCFYNMFSVGLWWMFNADLVDDFGKNHPIPENVEYCEPLSSFKSEWVDESGNTIKVDISSLFNPDDSTTWLQVSKGFQGGMYKYSYYISQEFDEGEIWLECYEVTDNVQLSKQRITESTVQKITAQDKGTYTEPKEFTIYEGVWGEYYLARFEVWYIDYQTRTKHKLTEKTYKVEGWMR